MEVGRRLVRGEPRSRAWGGRTSQTEDSMGESGEPTRAGAGQQAVPCWTHRGATDGPSGAAVFRAAASPAARQAAASSWHGRGSGGAADGQRLTLQQPRGRVRRMRTAATRAPSPDGDYPACARDRRPPRSRLIRRGSWEESARGRYQVAMGGHAEEGKATILTRAWTRTQAVWRYGATWAPRRPRGAWRSGSGEK